jgi:hypothetical protein
MRIVFKKIGYGKNSAVFIRDANGIKIMYHFCNDNRDRDSVVFSEHRC